MKKIIILTYAPQKTLGDPSAAAKLQQLLVEKFGEHHEELMVEVLVSVGKEDEIPVRNLFSDGMQYELINGFDTAIGKEQLKKAISDADLIIPYPTPHFLSENIANLLADTMRPVISLAEYDYDIEFQHLKKRAVEVVPGSVFLSSGLKEGNLGIYVEKYGGHSQIHPTDSSKLPNDLMLGDKQLYFGYFNKLSNSYTGATPSRFIAFAIHSSQKKEVDIILPLQSPEIPNINPENKGSILEAPSFIKDLEGFNQLQIAYMRPAPYPIIYLLYQREGEKLVEKEISEEEFEEQKNKSDKIIRVINPFPLHKDSMRALVEASEPINLLTGDQSFSEALSLSKIIFYQAMPWKRKFYEALIMASQKYSTLHQWLKMVDKSSTPIKSLTDFYEKNKEALLIETQALQKDFELNKNLPVNFLDYLNNFLNSSLYERFTQFMDHVGQHPEYYANEKESETVKVYTLSSKTLFKHLNFYLKSATTTDEKNKMISYFYAHIDSLIKLSASAKVWSSLDLKSRYPELNIVLTANSVIEALKGLSRLELDIYDSYGSPIFSEPEKLPTQSTADDQEDSDNTEDSEENEQLTEIMMSLRHILKLLALADISQFKPEEKLEILKQVMSCGAIYYSDGTADEHWLKFLENESDARVLRQTLKLLFTIPCYLDLKEGVGFDPDEPSLFFRITKYRSDLVETLLKSPTAMHILFEELFTVDNPSVKASNNAKINDLVLDALFFPHTSRISHSFFPTSSQKKVPSKERELICKMLSVEEKDQTTIMNFLQSKFAGDPRKIDRFRERLGENSPQYLRDFIDEQLVSPPPYK